MDSFAPCLRFVIDASESKKFIFLDAQFIDLPLVRLSNDLFEHLLIFP